MSHPFDAMGLTTLEGEPLAPDAYRGKALLVVNVASRCGLTPQYEELVALAQETAADGVAVLGVPCNQFGAQEPGSAEEIRTFCSTTYGVDFPLLSKQDVNGPDRSPLYQHLVGGGPDIEWNFGKFVVGPTGQVRGRFAPTVAPHDPAIMQALADALDR
ncbi:MAG: glutathione peroxidase [Myxococcales bacterium]|nr:glutathione peroxidase [Myxococcales bacterium]